MKKFKSVRALMEAVASREVPVDIALPCVAAKWLGVSRQAVWDRMTRGTLRGWAAPGVSYVDMADVRAIRREFRGLQRVRAMREQRNEGATAV